MVVLEQQVLVILLQESAYKFLYKNIFAKFASSIFVGFLLISPLPHSLNSLMIFTKTSYNSL
jgi:hypothetical protein